MSGLRKFSLRKKSMATKATASDDELLKMYGEFMIEHSSLLKQSPPPLGGDIEDDEDDEECVEVSTTDAKADSNSFWSTMMTEDEFEFDDFVNNATHPASGNTYYPYVKLPTCGRSVDVGSRDEDVYLKAFKEDVENAGVCLIPRNLDVIFDIEDYLKDDEATVVQPSANAVRERFPSLRIDSPMDPSTPEKKTDKQDSSDVVKQDKPPKFLLPRFTVNTGLNGAQQVNCLTRAYTEDDFDLQYGDTVTFDEEDGDDIITHVFTQEPEQEPESPDPEDPADLTFFHPALRRNVGYTALNVLMNGEQLEPMYESDSEDDQDVDSPLSINFEGRRGMPIWYYSRRHSFLEDEFLDDESESEDEDKDENADDSGVWLSTGTS